MTFLVGENGSGKSTIIEALASSTGFNEEGGSKNYLFSTQHTTSEMNQHIRVIRGGRREKDGFFLRAESFYNLASYMDAPHPLGPLRYGGKSFHEQSHGESFLALVQHRFHANGLYILDEPEAALSPRRQLALMAHIHDLVQRGSQFIIATHSPILLAAKDAVIYELSHTGIDKIAYRDTDHYRLTLDFLQNYDVYNRHLNEPI